MPRSVEIRHLELTQAIAAEGTITRAALRLNLTQSAVSTQLRELEAKLGATLFERSTRRLRITPAGERLLAVAGPVLEQLDSAERDIRQSPQSTPTLVRISTECYTTYHWLPALLTAVHSRLPGVEPRIVLEATHHPLEALMEGRLDIAIVTSVPSTRTTRAIELFTDELLVIMAPENPLSKRTWIDAEHFRDQKLITYDVGLEDLTVYQEVLRQAGILPTIFRVPLTEAILEMVQTNLGIAVLARWAAAPALDAGRVVGVRLTRSGFRRRWYAVTRNSRDVPACVHQLAQLIAESPAVKGLRNLIALPSFVKRAASR